MKLKQAIQGSKVRYVIVVGGGESYPLKVSKEQAIEAVEGLGWAEIEEDWEGPADWNPEILGEALFLDDEGQRVAWWDKDYGSIEIGN